MTHTQLKAGLIDNWDTISKEIQNQLLAKFRGGTGSTPVTITHPTKPGTAGVTLAFSDTIGGSSSGVVITVTCT